ncbi:hypothetical protein GWI33_019218 [Rhynchophorus ferrugineus]|uniref:NAD-dependent protein deacylase n=1 Tax=Rhynchophorus ferrugineus TaxID=354439 RepID=A0A834HYN1_RHYFE|nr:hypothetical protein GWI33_019218 [Rhynchophorus ferrugineus]
MYRSSDIRAGISAESGIPVFRGAGGLWRTHKALDLATPQAFRKNPALIWEFYHYRRNVAFNAQPNKAHFALAKFEEELPGDCQFHIVTQNIDGLHQRAGSKNVIELHGALSKIRCTNSKCKNIEVNTDSPICEALKDRGDPACTDKDLPEINVNDLPKCSKCGKLARPHIVWFGEHLDANILQRTRELIETCDICLIIGTSSVVYPAAMFAPLVADRGRPVAEFNLNEEPANEEFQFHFPGPCGTTLPKALGYDDSSL